MSENFSEWPQFIYAVCRDRKSNKIRELNGLSTNCRVSGSILLPLMYVHLYVTLVHHLTQTMGINRRGGVTAAFSRGAPKIHCNIPVYHTLIHPTVCMMMQKSVTQWTHMWSQSCGIRHTSMDGGQNSSRSQKGSPVGRLGFLHWLGLRDAWCHVGVADARRRRQHPNCWGLYGDCPSQLLNLTTQMYINGSSLSLRSSGLQLQTWLYSFGKLIK